MVFGSFSFPLLKFIFPFHESETFLHLYLWNSTVSVCEPYVWINPCCISQGSPSGWDGERQLLKTSSEHIWAQKPGLTAQGGETTCIQLFRNSMLQLRVLPLLLWREEMMGRSSFSCHQVPWLHTSVSIGWMLHSDNGKVPSPCKCDGCSPPCGTNPAHLGEYFAAANILCFPSSLLPLFLAVTCVTLRWNSTAHLLPTRVLSCWCLLFPALCTAHLERGVLVCCIHLTSSPHSHSSGHWSPQRQGACSWWVTAMSEFTAEASPLVLPLFTQQSLASLTFFRKSSPQILIFLSSHCCCPIAFAYSALAYSFISCNPYPFCCYLI